MNTWLANLPPTSRQSRAAIGVSVILVVVLGIVAPFASKQLAQINAFIPSFEAIVFVTDLITSVLLFSQFSISYAPALLALASGYLFTALIVIPHALTFPGAFSETGLLRAGLQSTAWLYWFWHFGFPVAVLAYGLLKNENQTKRKQPFSPLTAISLSVAFVIALVCGLTLLATVGDGIMPRLFQDRVHINPLNHTVGAVTVLVCMLSLAVLWARRSSVLDLWLMVVVVAATSELVLAVALVSGRYSLGFYAGRMFSLVTSTTVLVVLLTETTRLYARLVRSNIMLEQERSNKLMNLGAMAASISHEVRQPLTGMTTSGSALLRFLGDTPPKLEKARSSAEKVIAAGHHISQILDDIRNLFGTIERASGPVNMNDLALGALRALDEELKNQNIVTHTHLKPELPPVMGHSGQLQQVIVNLIQNAIDAMDSVDSDRRVLQVRTEHNGGDAISITIEDTGPGIDPKKSDDMFDAFFTTKPHGMGLGLAICRMIVERHDGELSVTSANPHGAIFRIELPQMKLPH
jgi:signal transduction histidine kinase